MKELLADEAALTACDPHSRLDRWLTEASAWAAAPEEAAYYRHNAWHLITTWGNSPTLNDYASRLWSGLVQYYYTSRWELFLKEELDCLKEGRPFDQKVFDEKCSALEKGIVEEAPAVQDLPAGNASELGPQLLHKWFPVEMELVSYNVGAFGKYAQSSIEGIARLLSDAQLVAVQETDSCNRRHNSFQVKYLADAMGGAGYHFASAFPFAGGAYGNGVLSREDILLQASIALPQADGSEPRSAAVVETPSCVFASTHLDYKSKAAAKAQAGVLNAWFTEHYSDSDKPVFLCGDFNALPESEVLEELEACWTLLSGTAPTHSGKCIDYILALKSARTVEVLEREVLSSERPLSDHDPVRIKVRF